MTMRIITRFTNTPSPNLRQLRKWGDPILRTDSYSVFVRLVDNEPIGQFSHLVPYMLDVNGNWLGTWAANSLLTPITHEKILKIASIQIADDFTASQKMDWLTCGGENKLGCPMICSGSWDLATDIRYIGAVWAGQCVEVIDHQTFMVTFNGKTEAIPMSRIKTFDDWDNLSRKHPQVQEITAVDNQDTAILPHGHIFMPLLLKGASNWVFDRWLV